MKQKLSACYAEIFCINRPSIALLGGGGELKVVLLKAVRKPPIGKEQRHQIKVCAAPSYSR